MLLSIPCRPNGKKLSRVLLFVQALCGDFQVESYHLIALSRNSRARSHIHDIENVMPGQYALISKTCPLLSVTHQPLPIIPRGNLTPKSSTSSTPGSPSSSKKRAHDETKVMINLIIVF